MSRSGYSVDFDGWELTMYRGAVRSAINGKRGQAFLREMIAALDAMPEKRLIRHELVCEDGVCAMGAVAQARGLDVEGIDEHEYEEVAAAFGIADSLAREIAFENDEHETYYTRNDTPEERWQRMRDWAVAHIKEPTHAD